VAEAWQQFKWELRDTQPEKIIVLWSAKAAESARMKVLGNHRWQSQQSRVELGLRFSRGF